MPRISPLYFSIIEVGPVKPWLVNQLITHLRTSSRVGKVAESDVQKPALVAIVAIDVEVVDFEES